MKAGLHVNKILDLTMGTRVRHPDASSPIQGPSGVTNEDATGKPEKLVEEYEVDFCMATSLIVQALSNEIFHIVGALSKDPIAMWRALVDRFERVTKQSADFAKLEV